MINNFVTQTKLCRRCIYLTNKSEFALSEKINMNAIRRQVYLSYTEDGLVDLAIGLVIFSFAVLLMIDLAWMVGLLGGISLLIWFLGKRHLTIPRIGTIQPDKLAKKQFKGFSVSMIIMGLGVLVFFILVAGTGGNLLGDHPLALFGLVLALGISALGLMMKTNRLHFYATLVFASMAIGVIMNKSIETMDVYLLSVLAAGGIILVAGSIVLIGFLQKYPVDLLDE